MEPATDAPETTPSPADDRPAGRSRSRPVRIILKLRWALYALVVLYGLLYLYPPLFFPFRAEKHNITLRATAPLPPAAETRLDEIHAVLRDSELYDPAVEADVLVCNNLTLYRLLFPFHGGMYSMARPGKRRVFIARADLEGDRTGYPDIDTSRRTFTAVAVHELTHVMIRRHVENNDLPRPRRWVAEGYCEYVSGNYNFPVKKGLAILNAGIGDRIDNENFDYFTWELMVRYLVERRGLGFDGILARQDDYDRIYAEMRTWAPANPDTCR